MQNKEQPKVTPIASFWEYMDAKTTLDWYFRKIQMPGAPPLSPQDEREFQDLKQRVLAYATNPTPLKVMKAKGGNVDHATDLVDHSKLQQA